MKLKYIMSCIKIILFTVIIVNSVINQPDLKVKKSISQQSSNTDFELFEKIPEITTNILNFNGSLTETDLTLTEETKRQGLTGNSQLYHTKTEDTSKKSLSQIHENLYGMWLITEVAFVNKDNAVRSDRPMVYEDKYIGSVIEYNKDFCKIDEKIFEEPIYITDEDYFWTDNLRWEYEGYVDFCNRYPVEKSKRVFIMTNEYKKIDVDFGNVIYVMDEKHILIEGFSLFILAEKVTSEELKTLTIPKPPEKQNPTYLYGKWKVIDTSNNSNKMSSKYLNQIYEYQKSYCVFNGQKYYNPNYSYTVTYGDSLSEMNMTFDDKVTTALLEKYNTNRGTLRKKQNIIFENTEAVLGCSPEYFNENYIRLWADGGDEALQLIAQRIE